VRRCALLRFVSVSFFNGGNDVCDTGKSAKRCQTVGTIRDVERVDVAHRCERAMLRKGPMNLGFISEILFGFTGLISITNPFGIAFVFLERTSSLSDQERTALAKQIAINALCVLCVAFFIGTPILHFFGISMQALRIAGGLAVAVGGWQMLNAPDRKTPAPMFPLVSEADAVAMGNPDPAYDGVTIGQGAASPHASDEGEDSAATAAALLSAAAAAVAASPAPAALAAMPTVDADNAASKAFFPLTVPLTTGPGAIATAIALNANRGHRLSEFLVSALISIVISLMVALVIYVTYSRAATFAQYLGAEGTKVAMRISAFLLLCVGVQIMLTGIADFLSPILAAHLSAE